MNNEKVKLKIGLTEEEKAKLEHDTTQCGLTQASIFGNSVWESGVSVKLEMTEDSGVKHEK